MMENLTNIELALRHCAASGYDSCDGCPYKEMIDDNRSVSCRSLLCTHSAEAIRELQKEKTVVCSCKNDEKQTDSSVFNSMLEKVGEAVRQADYWRGYAAAIRWAFCDRYDNMTGDAEAAKNE